MMAEIHPAPLNKKTPSAPVVRSERRSGPLRVDLRFAAKIDIGQEK
jgi:hypothetical protein